MAKWTRWFVTLDVRNCLNFREENVYIVCPQETHFGRRDWGFTGPSAHNCYFCSCGVHYTASIRHPFLVAIPRQGIFGGCKKNVLEESWRFAGE